MNKTIIKNFIPLFAFLVTQSCSRKLINRSNTTCSNPLVQTSKMLPLVSQQLAENIDPNWQGGLFTFDRLPSATIFDPTAELPKTQVSCTGLFEFLAKDDGYKIKTYTQHQCFEPYRLWAAKGEVKLFTPENGQHSAGYITIPIINPEFSKRINILRNIKFADKPGEENNPDSNAKKESNIARAEFVNYSLPAMVKGLPHYFYKYFEKNNIKVSDSFYKTLCTDEANAKNSIHAAAAKPQPDDCVWPQDLLITELFIDNKYISSNKNLLNNLVLKTKELQKGRKAKSDVSKQVNSNLEIFINNWNNALNAAETLQNYQAIADKLEMIMNYCNSELVAKMCEGIELNQCIADGKAYCIFYKNITPTFLSFFDKQLQDLTQALIVDEQVSQSEYDDFLLLLNEKKKNLDKYLASIYDHINNLPELLKNNKTNISVFANHLTTEIPKTSMFAFKEVALFPNSQGKSEKELQGIIPKIKDNALFLSFDMKATNLRQPIHNGSIITIDNFPVFALTASTTQSDGVALMPAPAPQKRESGDESINTNCMPK